MCVGTPRRELCVLAGHTEARGELNGPPDPSPLEPVLCPWATTGVEEEQNGPQTALAFEPKGSPSLRVDARVADPRPNGQDQNHVQGTWKFGPTETGVRPTLGSPGAEEVSKPWGLFWCCFDVREEPFHGPRDFHLAQEEKGAKKEEGERHGGCWTRRARDTDRAGH